MPTGRFPVRDIQGFMPSVDARASSKTHLISGRNFIWDSFGPKSGFGALQMTPFPIQYPRDIHGVRVQGRSLVFTQDAILAWRTKAPFGWDVLYTFDTQVPPTFRFPWQVIYLNGKLFLSHPYRGFFSAEVESESGFWLHPETAATIPGLPPGIKGMGVVRGRAILVNDYQISWSSVGDLSDLTPAEEGAGFQLISGIVKGTYIGLSTFNDGFIVWTTEGAVLGQYTGDEVTWRFDPFVSQERPLSAWTTVELTTGGSAFLSRRGLFVSGNAENPEPWIPQFNEFFREYTKNKGSLAQYFFRLEYDAFAETVYILESKDLLTFDYAYAMSPTIDKFGIFSEPVYGMLPITQERFGYVRENGIPMYFADVFGREEEPPNELGLDRHYPLIQKSLNIPSSSAVSWAVTFDPTSPSLLTEIPRAGWFTRGNFLPYSPYLGGMDSWVEIGYLRVDELNMAADALMEIQEIAIGGIPVAAPTPMDWRTAWKEDFFYRPHEDWDTPITMIPGDRIFDAMLEDGEADLMLGPNFGHEDFRYLNYPTLSQPVTETEDWNEDGETEDWNDATSGFPALTYGIEIQSSQDGISVDRYVPSMAKFNSQTQEWSVLSSGTYTTIRLEAIQPTQYYHVKAIDLTISYAGQQS